MVGAVRRQCKLNQRIWQVRGVILRRMVSIKSDKFMVAVALVWVLTAFHSRHLMSNARDKVGDHDGTMRLSFKRRLT